jgi:DNA end-binding protein Ku
MAERLVEEMTDEWNPAKYKDSYRDDLLAKIDEKVRTGKITPAHEPARESDGGTVIDIMELLKKSLDRREADGKKAEGPKGGPRKASTRKAAKASSGTA